MVETKKNWILIEKIIENSVSKDFLAAKNEWCIDDIYEIENREDFSECICGHYPIKEIIEIKNKHNQNRLIVGNCCIKIIIGSDKKNFFSAIKHNKVNKPIIEEGFRDHILNEWEYNFMLSVFRKRKMSEKQQIKYSVIKDRLIQKYKR